MNTTERQLIQLLNAFITSTPAPLSREDFPAAFTHRLFTHGIKRRRELRQLTTLSASIKESNAEFAVLRRLGLH